MDANYLFPASWRKAGWYVTIPFFVIGIFLLIGGNIFDYNKMPSLMKFMDWDYLDEITAVSLIIGLVLIGFSRERDEDECIAAIRTRALIWSVYAGYALTIGGTLFIYGLAYLTFMCVNMFSILILFVLRYQWLIHSFRKESHGQ